MDHRPHHDGPMAMRIDAPRRHAPSRDAAKWGRAVCTGVDACSLSRCVGDLSHFASMSVFWCLPLSYAHATLRRAKRHRLAKRASRQTRLAATRLAAFDSPQPAFFRSLHWEVSPISNRQTLCRLHGRREFVFAAQVDPADVKGGGSVLGQPADKYPRRRQSVGGAEPEVGLNSRY